MFAFQIYHAVVWLHRRPTTNAFVTFGAIGQAYEVYFPVADELI